MFFDSWFGVARVCVVGALAYAVLVVLLRVSGKRTLSKMNAFDWVVTVALGSSLASVLLSKDVVLIEGATAFVVLIGLQYLVAWAATRSSRVERLVKSSPALIYYRGEFLRDVLRRERLTESEIRAAVREQGIESLTSVEAVVLEAAGELSVLRASDTPFTILADVSGRPST